MNYNFNITRIIKQVVPVFLQKPVSMAWLSALCSPVAQVYDDFIQTRIRLKYEATINSQVIRFEKALRDKFNDATIYIFHPDLLTDYFEYQDEEGQANSFVLYQDEENEPAVFLYSDEEDQSQFDFIIKVPAFLMGQAPAIYAYTDKYRIAGKRFKIEQI